MNEAPQKYSHY